MNPLSIWMQKVVEDSWFGGCRVEAVRWLFFRGTASTTEEVSTVLNCLRDFAVAGASCTGHAARLLESLPRCSVHQQGQEKTSSRTDVCAQHINRILSLRLGRWLMRRNWFLIAITIYLACQMIKWIKCQMQYQQFQGLQLKMLQRMQPTNDQSLRALQEYLELQEELIRWKKLFSIENRLLVRIANGSLPCGPGNAQGLMSPTGLLGWSWWTGYWYSIWKTVCSRTRLDEGSAIG